MRTKEEIFDETIFEYNKNVNNISKFAFNNRERELFLNMMELYANQVELDEIDHVERLKNLLTPFVTLPQLIVTKNNELNDIIFDCAKRCEEQIDTIKDHLNKLHTQELHHRKIIKNENRQLTEDDLLSCGFTKNLMFGTGWTSISSMCEPIYYYNNGRIGINATTFWTWFLDGEQRNDIAVSSKEKLMELLLKINTNF